MNRFGLLDVAGIIFTLTGGIVSIPHIHTSAGQVFVVTCCMLGVMWLIFALNHTPVRLTGSHTASTNGVIIFAVMFAALIVIIHLGIFTQDPHTQQLWWWLGLLASSVASARLLAIYWSMKVDTTRIV